MGKGEVGLFQDAGDHLLAGEQQGIAHLPQHQLEGTLGHTHERGSAQDAGQGLGEGAVVDQLGSDDVHRSGLVAVQGPQEGLDGVVEVNPRDANNLGLRDGAQVWVEGPEGAKVKVMAMLTERVGEGVAFMPFHFGGHFQGEDLRSKYPDGADPYVLGESTNTAQTYGYDSVTQMQETKATLCKIWAA